MKLDQMNYARLSAITVGLGAFSMLGWRLASMPLPNASGALSLPQVGVIAGFGLLWLHLGVKWVNAIAYVQFHQKWAVSRMAFGIERMTWMATVAAIAAGILGALAGNAPVFEFIATQRVLVIVGAVAPVLASTIWTIYAARKGITMLPTLTGAMALCSITVVVLITAVNPEELLASANRDPLLRGIMGVDTLVDRTR